MTLPRYAGQAAALIFISFSLNSLASPETLLDNERVCIYIYDYICIYIYDYICIYIYTHIHIETSSNIWMATWCFAMASDQISFSAMGAQGIWGCWGDRLWK